MRRQLFLWFLILSCSNAVAQNVFTPPPQSASAVTGAPFAAAQPVGARFRVRFQACEAHDTCDGIKQKFRCSTDPSHNTVLLRFPNGTIFFKGKMGLDADGSPLSKTRGGTNLPETSFRFAVAGHPSVMQIRLRTLSCLEGVSPANWVWRKGILRRSYSQGRSPSPSLPMKDQSARLAKALSSCTRSLAIKCV